MLSNAQAQTVAQEMLLEHLGEERLRAAVDARNQTFLSSRELKDAGLDETQGVFISYRESPVGKAAAKRVNSYLRQHGLLTWFFPPKVGWGDNQYKSIADAIGAARAAVTVFTPDFPSGPSAEQEYYSLLAERTQEPDFKTGLLLVGANQSDVPPLMTHYFSVSVKDATDIDFEVQADKIYRGLLGLPLEGEE